MFQEMVDVRFSASPHPDTWDQNVGLTPQEVDKFHQYAGKHTLDEFENLIEMPLYQQFRERAVAGDLLARERLHLMIRGAIQKARAEAKKDLLDDPDVGSAVKQRLEAFADLQKEKSEMIMGQ